MGFDGSNTHALYQASASLHLPSLGMNVYLKILRLSISYPL